MLKLLFTLILTVSFTQAHSQTIYECPTEDGSVIFTDQKCDDGDTYTLEHQNVATPSLRTPVDPAIDKDATDEISYQLEITSPAQEQTITPGEQTVTITTAITPAPPSGSQYRLMVNGNSVSQASSSRFTLTDLIRGQYDIVVALIDSEGNAIAQSETRTIYVHRPSVNQRKTTLPASSGFNSFK